MSILNPSRAFRRGFAEGFSAPITFWFGRRYHIRYSRVATDAAAWREVGSLLNQSYREVGEELGKNASKTPGSATKQKR